MLDSDQSIETGKEPGFKQFIETSKESAFRAVHKISQRHRVPSKLEKCSRVPSREGTEFQAEKQLEI